MAASYTLDNEVPRYGFMTARDRLECPNAPGIAIDQLSALDDDEQEEVYAALKAGFSVSELATVYDVSRMTIMGVDGRF